MSDNKGVVTESMCYENQKRFVPVRYFLWAMTLFTVVIGWQFAVINNLDRKVQDTTTNNQTIETQLAQIQTDLQWIKIALAEHNEN